MTTAGRGNASAAHLPDFDNPPVVEVALGVEFQPVADLGAANLTRFADRWSDRFPLLREVPPLPPGPAPGERLDRPAMVVNVGAPAIRLWRLSADQEQLLQVQRDRLVLNWRRQNALYPHYDQLRPLFREALEDLVTFLGDQQLGAVHPTAAELTYVNRLDPLADGVTALRQTLVGGSLLWGIPGQQAELRVKQTWRRDHENSPATLSVSADSTPRDGAVLSLTYREALAPGIEIDGVLASLDRGHVAIVIGFADVTTETMHNRWRRRG